MMHVWQYFGGILPEANKAIEQIGAFVKSINVKTKADKLEALEAVSYTHLRAHETVLDIVCRLLLEQKNRSIINRKFTSLT